MSIISAHIKRKRQHFVCWFAQCCTHDTTFNVFNFFHSGTAWRSWISTINAIDNNPIIEAYKHNKKLVLAWNECKDLLREQFAHQFRPNDSSVAQGVHRKIKIEPTESNQNPAMKVKLEGCAPDTQTNRRCAVRNARIIRLPPMSIKIIDPAATVPKQNEIVGRMTRTAQRKIDPKVAAPRSINIKIAPDTVATKQTINIKIDPQFPQLPVMKIKIIDSETISPNQVETVGPITRIGKRKLCVSNEAAPTEPIQTSTSKIKVEYCAQDIRTNLRCANKNVKIRLPKMKVKIDPEPAAPKPTMKIRINPAAIARKKNNVVGRVTCSAQRKMKVSKDENHISLASATATCNSISIPSIKIESEPDAPKSDATTKEKRKRN